MSSKENLIYPLVMAFMMSCFVSGVVTTVNLRFGPHLPRAWFSAWCIAFPSATLAIYGVAPVARRVARGLAAAIWGRATE